MSEKVKKPLWKRWWFWLLAVIVIGGAASSGDDTTPKTNSSEVEATTAQPVTEEKPAATEPKQEAPKNEPTITMDEFKQIQNGMTYEQVVQIIGGEGELISTAGDGQYKIEMYQWEGEGGFGANANVTLEGGKVTAKAQLGLQ